MDNNVVYDDNRPPLLIVLSGPSGVGKDATVRRMRAMQLPVHVIVTATTRPKRPNEQDGQDYYFISEGQFYQMRETGGFLEWAKVYKNYYGVPQKEIKEALEIGQDVLIKVDVQGAATIKRLLPDSVLIFLMPPSFQDLSERLLQRSGGHSPDLDVRLNTAHEEIRKLDIFDYVVVSTKDNLDLIISKINAIITAEKCRVHPRIVKL